MSSVIGFRDTWPFGYRLYNVAVATLLLVALSPTILLLAFLLLITQGPNILYFGPRMGKNQRPFQIIKFRTLCPKRARAITADRTLPADANIETRLGKILREVRLDELPQLWNILRGDMSFVGPRPPLPRFVRLCPEIYAEVLKNRPGVTGLATLVFHKREERLLAQCHTQSETDAVYLRRCVPAKAKIDLIWARNRTVCFDLILILATVRRVFAFRG